MDERFRDDEGPTSEVAVRQVKEVGHPVGKLNDVSVTGVVDEPQAPVELERDTGSVEDLPVKPVDEPVDDP